MEDKTLSEQIDKRLDSEDDYLALIHLLINVVEVSNSSGDERLIHAKGLALKLAQHTLSALYLSRGTKMPDFKPKPISFIDNTSIDVLARAVYETYLIFHYVFISSGCSEEQDFRFWSWKAAGLAERQNYSASTPEHIETKEKDKEELKECKEKIFASNYYKGLNKEFKRKISRYLDKVKGDWKTQSWRQIAEDVGLHEMIYEQIYPFLCGHAHSGFISVIQVEEPAKRKSKPSLLHGSMLIVNMVLANFVTEYCNLLPRAKEGLGDNPELISLIETWVHISRNLNTLIIE